MRVVRIILYSFALSLCANCFAAESAHPPLTLKDSKVGDWVEYRISSTVNHGSPVVTRLRNTVTEKFADKVIVQTASLDEVGKPAHFTASESRLDTLAAFGDVTKQRETGKKDVVVGHRTLTCSFIIAEPEAEKSVAIFYSPEVPLGGVVRIDTKTKTFTSEQILTAFGSAETPAKP